MYSLHEETNDHGKLLGQLAAANRMIIQSICFKHKKIHLGTWKIPGSGITNQIDHVLVSARYASSIMDVRVARGPNCDSDHFLLRVVVRERLAAAQIRKPRERRKWDLEKLKDSEISCKFKVEIEKRIEENIDHMGLTERWERMKKAIIEAAETTIGEKKLVRNEWFDQDCATAIQKKNEARRNLLQRSTRGAQEKYNSLRKEANKICRYKKKCK